MMVTRKTPATIKESTRLKGRSPLSGNDVVMLKVRKFATVSIASEDDPDALIDIIDRANRRKELWLKRLANSAKKL